MLVCGKKYFGNLMVTAAQVLTDRGHDETDDFQNNEGPYVPTDWIVCGPCSDETGYTLSLSSADVPYIHLCMIQPQCEELSTNACSCAFMRPCTHIHVHECMHTHALVHTHTRLCEWSGVI